VETLMTDKTSPARFDADADADAIDATPGARLCPSRHAKADPEEPAAGA
jgi:hypothetical protein